ncbi:hypothetical protein IRP42_004574 [Salmonella enterica]|nr:hypothetical protein [Salmonella enterica]
MRKKLFSCVLLFFCLLTSRAYAGCNLLWSLGMVPRVQNIDISVNGEQSFFKKDFAIEVGGTYKLLKKDYHGIIAGSFLPLPGTVRYWIQYDDGWKESSGVKYKISSVLSTPNANQIPGTATVVSPLIKHDWESDPSQCGMNVGENTLFISHNITGMSLEVDTKNTLPGVYTIRLPIRVAYEENKQGSDEAYQSYPSLISNEPYLRSNITVNVKALCSFPSSKLNVSFGNITDKDVLNGVEKIVKFPMNCRDQAIVKMTLNGGDKGGNVTSCGQGTCTLTFDEGSSTANYLRSSGYNETNIHVKLKSNKAFTGQFTGSAILTVYFV